VKWVGWEKIQLQCVTSINFFRRRKKKEIHRQFGYQRSRVRRVVGVKKARLESNLSPGGTKMKSRKCVCVGMEGGRTVLESHLQLRQKRRRGFLYWSVTLQILGQWLFLSLSTLFYLPDRQFSASCLEIHVFIVTL